MPEGHRAYRIHHLTKHSAHLRGIERSHFPHASVKTGEHFLHSRRLATAFPGTPLPPQTIHVRGGPRPPASRLETSQAGRLVGSELTTALKLASARPLQISNIENGKSFIARPHTPARCTSSLIRASSAYYSPQDIIRTKRRPPALSMNPNPGDTSARDYGREPRKAKPTRAVVPRVVGVCCVWTRHSCW